MLHCCKFAKLMPCLNLSPQTCSNWRWVGILCTTTHHTNISIHMVTCAYTHSHIGQPGKSSRQQSIKTQSTSSACTHTRRARLYMTYVSLYIAKTLNTKYCMHTHTTHTTHTYIQTIIAHTQHTRTYKHTHNTQTIHRHTDRFTDIQ